MGARIRIKMIMLKIKQLISFLIFQFIFSVNVWASQDPNLSTPPTESALQAMSPFASVKLRALDKITTRITEITLRVGDEISFGTLLITARYCRSRPPEETPESFAYLEVKDKNTLGEHIKIFEGWMMASSPALSAMEHPVYDVWIIGCKISEPIVSKPKE